MAIGDQRVYVGLADRFEILVYDLGGARIGSLQSGRRASRVSTEDVERAKTAEIALKGNERRAAVERDYAMMRLPKVLPAYDRIIVDAVGYVWVRPFPRAGEENQVWSVFGPSGREDALAELPSTLEVFEIGVDYVLGRYLDEDELVPEVRAYRLKRSTNEVKRETK